MAQSGNLLQRLSRRVAAAPVVQPRLASRFEFPRAAPGGFSIEDSFVDAAPASASPAVPTAMTLAQLVVPTADVVRETPPVSALVPPLVQPVPSRSVGVEPPPVRGAAAPPDAADNLRVQLPADLPPALQVPAIAPPPTATAEHGKLEVRVLESTTTVLEVHRDVLTQPLPASVPMVATAVPAAVRAATSRRGEPMGAMPPAAAVRPEPAAPGPIEITIGRIELRAADEPRLPMRPSPPPAHRPALPLADYLRRRDGQRG